MKRSIDYKEMNNYLNNPLQLTLLHLAVTARSVALLLILVFAFTAHLEAAWPGAEKDPHPCLYVTAQDVAKARAALPKAELEALAKKKFVDHYDGVGNVVANELVFAALVAKNRNAEKAVVNVAFQAIDKLIAAMPVTIQKRVGPHAYSRQAGLAASLADAALAGNAITPTQRTQLLNKIVQVNTMLHHPDYWDPKTGKCSLNPNMTTSANGYRITFAALIPSHPKAKGWFDAGFKALKQEVEDWIDPQGGMIECPHYSMVIFDQWIAGFLIARNAKAPDDGNLFNPKLKKAIEWFGNISTPRDAKSQNFRRLPSLGHTYAKERTNMFGTIACLWKDKDPEFAAQMAWMYKEQGEFPEPGILSYYPGMMGYRRFFRDCGLQPKPPAWASAVYSETGVLLRNTIASERETVLYMIAGRNHSHYFNDSGSITVWGKGRELCTEDDYQNRRNKESREAHSMPDKPSTYNGERVMAIREFSHSQTFDYMRGTRLGWQRQIAFAKDTDPLGPNYFVVADTLDAKSVPTVWRLFLGGKIVPTPGGVTLQGPEDVDMDVIFVRTGGAKPTIHDNHIQLSVKEAGTVTVVLYPRLKTERSPRVTPLVDGRGMTVQTQKGLDTIFLDPYPVSFKSGQTKFEGKAGLVRNWRGKQTRIKVGPCDVAPGWKGGDRELRTIRWEGPQYPKFPDK
jgi:hypothetical protein